MFSCRPSSLLCKPRCWQVLYKKPSASDGEGGDPPKQVEMAGLVKKPERVDEWEEQAWTDEEAGFGDEKKSQITERRVDKSDERRAEFKPPIEEDLFADLGITAEYKGVRTLDKMKKQNQQKRQEEDNWKGLSEVQTGSAWDEDLDLPLD